MSSIVCLDIGTVRIGVASASIVAKLPSPLTTISNDEHAVARIRAILEKESAELLVVGLPRSLSGDETDQTKYTRSFAKALEPFASIVFQDEALTSKKARAELDARRKPYTKEDIDALAATYILEDYLSQQRN